MIGHLGSRASALLDGQLSVEEAERCWAHVHACHACRDLVEREGWIKTQLAELSFGVATPSTPAWLKGSILGACGAGPAEATGALDAGADHRLRHLGLAALGGSAVGAAVVGVLVLGVGAADAPTIDRRAPVTSITNTDIPRAPAPTLPVARLSRGGESR